ncbi:hypothetical protein K1T71_007697 [Dendrolimus kikuchii]|uniref:Uncharacterized protein n=1 Tax=Dendrolimus kikuchii TaxID=765133 RepID=A0ACC1CYU2_9NEOP|nr:hypothetical protein K1T71_007697 [Dendrolimus kikuchii]
MCCGCESVIGNAIGNTLYVLERIASCCAFTALVTCIIASLTVILGFGIGLGYNYCLVEVKTPKAGGSGDITSNTTNTTSKPGDRILRRFDLSDYAINSMAMDSTTGIEPTMRIPMNSAVDFLGLLSKIREFKKPVTLELFV